MDSQTKENIKQALIAGDFKSVIAMGKPNHILRQLISLSYDRSGLVARRAIEAAGFLTAGLKEAQAHDAIERIFVMMRDESGGNPWSAPELIGEMIRVNMRRFAHLIPILVSFHDEAMFTAGILQALARIAPDSPDAVLPYRELAFISMKSHDPEVRAGALMMMEGLDDTTYIDQIAGLRDDVETVLFYDGAGISSKTVGEIARRVCESLKKEKGPQP